MRKGNGSKALIVLLALCLAGLCLLSAGAWRIIRERQDGALWHEQELRYISEGTPSVAADITLTSMDDSTTPEPEAFEEMEPVVFTGVEDFAIMANPPLPTGTPEPERTTRKMEETSSMPASAQTAKVMNHVSSMSMVTPAPTAPTVGRSVFSGIRYIMDFAQLSVINEDVRGWLIAEDSTLNYPVVQGEDNEYYLTHLFSGEKNKTGAVFMDCGNSCYFTDMCIWLYGHNRQDATMFASIPEYAEQAYFDAHPGMYLLTPYGDYLVELFACIRGNIAAADEWHVKSFDSKAAFERYVEHIRGQSSVKSNTKVLWGDQLLAMSTCTNQVHEERYILFGVLRPIIYEDEAGMSVTQLDLGKRESYTKTVEISGLGKAVYYAQNDPTWSNMIYEARKTASRRRFGSSGCGPTALAMAIANLADDEQLRRLLVCPSSEYGYSICTCSVNQYFCSRTHVQLRIAGLEDLKRYLPLVMANFATGNNLWGVQSRSSGAGTSTTFFPYVASACSLSYSASHDFAEALEALRNGGVAVASTGGSASPFTGGGHYVTLSAMDMEYLYILDPYLKESYRDTDKGHVLEVLEPGLVRVRWEDADKLRLYGFYIFQQRKGYIPPMG